MLGIALGLGAVAPASSAGPDPRVRMFGPPESVEMPSRTGFVPPPGDFSHLTANRAPRPFASLPVRFDWRDQGVITRVDEQGVCGACYTFAALSNFESAILIDGGAVWDFSENNAKECDWWALNTGLGSCNGGNANMIASFLSQKGTALETCDPYVPSNRVCRDTCAFYFTLTGWLQISGDVVPPAATIKDYVYNYGPMFTAMIAANGESGWPSEMAGYDGTYTLHYEGTGGLDHAVMIVGWDDTLSHDGGQGAWIVKNSWGDDWGESGFFYIAYGSAKIGTYASTIYDWEPYNPNGVVLFYDDAGFMGTAFGYENLTGWALAKYVPAESLRVERVEFWTTDGATDVDVYIYDGFDGNNLTGELARQENNVIEEYGYHSIQLSSPVEVSADEDIYVVVKITNNSYSFPIAIDNWGPASPGMCYVSPDGGTWTNVTTIQDCSNCDVCIRVRGTSGVTGGVIRVPGQYATIGAGIAAAEPGDTVLVGPGTYEEGGLIIDKDIVLLSEAGPESTIVEAGSPLAGQEAHSFVLGLANVTSACQVIGLSFRGAESAATGGGIVITNSAPDIIECVVACNSAPAGAGMVVEGSSPSILNCTVVDNVAYAGIYFDAGSSGQVDRCIVTGTEGGPGIYCSSGAPAIGCCDIHGNVGSLVGGKDNGGNFSEDPLYCGRVNGDYHLQEGSPCIDGYGCGQVGALGQGCGSQIPAMLASFMSTAGDGFNRLTWVLPGEPVEGAYIVYKTTGYPAGWEDGTGVENGMSGYFSGEAAAADTFDHAGLINGVTYYYAAYAYNLDWKSDSGSLDSATPMDMTPPGPAEYFNAQSGDSAMTLSWTYPSDEDLVGVLVRYSTSNYPSLPTDGNPLENGSDGEFLGEPGSDTSFVHAGLDNDTTYYYSAFSYDAAENYSEAAMTRGTAGVDDTPPGEVRSFVALPSDSAITLSWLNPSQSDFVHTILRYSTSAYPGTPLDGMAVENGEGGIFPGAPASADTFVHTGLDNGVTHYYTAFTADTIPNYSSGASVFAVPLDAMPPAPVTGLSAHEGDSEAILRWTNPADVDFAGVRIVYSTVSYPVGPMDGVVANPGGTPAPVDTFVHTGLENETTYYYSVFAMDEVPNYSEAENVQATPYDQTGPVLTISVFRNPYLSNYLDIYVMADEALLMDSLKVTVGGAEIDMETSDADDYVYRGDYNVYSTGVITIFVRATDLGLNPGTAERLFSSSLILASGGGAAESADEAFRLTVPPGAATQDGYVLIWEMGPETDRSLSAYEASPGPFELVDYVAVEIAYDETVGDPEHLLVTRGTGERRVRLDSYVDADSRCIVAYTRELGVFSLTRDEDSVSPPAGGGEVTILFNSPNPFKNTTEIAYQVPRDSHLSIEIIGIDGRLVRSLYSGDIAAGRHSITWDGREGSGVKVASGIYFVRIISPSGIASRKIAVLR